MIRIIGDRTKKSALDEMEEVARARNRDVAEEERLEALRKAKEPKAEEPLIITADNSPSLIISEIEAKIGKDGELYKALDNSNELWTKGNALMALYFAVTGNKEKAEKIVSEIETKIGIHKGFYLHGNKKDKGNWHWKSLEENAAMALYFAVTGDRKKAENIISNIESKIGRKGILYVQYAESENICSEGNAIMALYFAATGKMSNAEDIVSGIEAISGKYYEMYTSPNNANLWTGINAVMALYFAVTGDGEKAERIVSGIESKIGRHGRLYRLFKEDTTLWVKPSALMCLYFAVKAGARLEAR